MIPPVRLMIAVAAAVAGSDYLGDKLANKIVGPEIGPSDAMINNVKIVGAKVGVGLVIFTALRAVLKAA